MKSVEPLNERLITQETFFKRNYFALSTKQHPAFQGVGEKGIYCQSRAIPWRVFTRHGHRSHYDAHEVLEFSGDLYGLRI